MTSPTGSPLLPPFGIRDLFDHAPQPSLISITAGQYRSTIASQPDAFLRYIDDDDGELITVGSAHELKEKLEEEVKEDNSPSRHPLSGELLHVFDISQSPASLAEWRDHEAHSTKHFSAKAQSLPSTHHTKAHREIPEEQDRPFAEQESPRDQPDGDAAVIADQIITGLEFHLDSLAKILRGAADTLQKAAQKTRETDTSVVEDILTGVRGIFTEVGALGSDLLKTLDHNTVDPSISSNPEPISLFQNSVCSVEPSSNVPSIPSPSFNSVASCDLYQSTAGSVVEPRTQSILDGDAEDLAFAARYPPLQSVRRAQTVSAPVARYQPYAGRAQVDPIWTPYVSAPRQFNESITTMPDVSRPLPGAWPEAKAETAPVLPASKESSGAFFNRMTGRMRQTDEESALKPGVSLHRANTTASTNPASRLSGPFDPNLPLPRSLKRGVNGEKTGRSVTKAHVPSSWMKRSKSTLKSPISAPAKVNVYGLDHSFCSSYGDTRSHRARNVPCSTPASSAEELKAAREQKKPIWAQSARDPPATSADLSSIQEAAAAVDYFAGTGKSTFYGSQNWSEGTNIGVTPLCTQKSPPRTCDLAGSHFNSKTDCNTDPQTSPSTLQLQQTDPAALHDCLTRRSDSLPKSLHAQAESDLGKMLSMARVLSSREFPAALRPHHSWSIPEASASYSSQLSSGTKSQVSASTCTPSSSSSHHDSHLESRSSVVSTAAQLLLHSPDQSSSVPSPYVCRVETESTARHEPAASIESTVSSSDVLRDDKIDICLSQLKDLGFGLSDPNLADRLRVYAIASEGDIVEAVDMIEEDQRLSREFSDANSTTM